MHKQGIAFLGAFAEPTERHQDILSGRSVLCFRFRPFVIRQHHDFVDMIMAFEKFLYVDHIVDAASSQFVLFCFRSFLVLRMGRRRTNGMIEKEIVLVYKLETTI